MNQYQIRDLSCNNISISQILETGSAKIESYPAGAQIVIDNKLQTQITPAIINGISYGIHTYKLTYPGYIDANGILFIETGKTYEVLAIMVKISTNPFWYIMFGTIAFGTFITFYKKSNNKPNNK